VAWLYWLSPPVVAGVLAALYAWWPGRPRRRANTRGSIRAHGRFLDRLGREAVAVDRTGTGD
jgi:hypothetical protein